MGQAPTKIISIHAPRVGSDCGRWATILAPWVISIHAPRVGSDGPSWCRPLPARHFNPRSPCGERHHMTALQDFCYEFQSTLPVWGATDLMGLDTDFIRFQSTLPVWGATPCRYDDERIARISIHAPRVGSDRIIRMAICTCVSFQSTLPVWGATAAFGAVHGANKFQSTLPVWGATSVQKRMALATWRFQSTLPVWGATRTGCRGL